jgi:hypothetical protein
MSSAGSFLKEENAMSGKQPSFRSPFYLVFILLVVSALLMAGCGGKPAVLAATPTSGPASPTPLISQPTPVSVVSSPVPLVHTATPIVLTATPVLALDTPTAVLANNPAPLNQSQVATIAPLTTAPTATTAVQAAAVASVPVMMGSFALIAGTTAGVIQGTVQPGQVLQYTLPAGQAQPLTLIMESPSNDVTLGVFDPSHIALLDPARKLRAWQTALPTTGTYTIQITGGAITESFTLTIKLPVPVLFAAGTTSTSLNNSTVNGYLFGYALNCAEGQTMTATLNQPPSIATIDIYGLDTGTLLQAASNVSSWTGVLPQTQDYVVEVIPTGNRVVNFGLTLSCTGTPGNVYYPPVNNGNGNGYSGGGSIVFAPNTTAAVMQGTINPGQRIAYTIQASQYQAMTIKVESTNKDVTLEVYDPSGSLAFDPAKLYANWQMTLYQTGLYTIKLVGGAYSEAYTLTTKVAKLFTVPTDTHTITLYGTNHGGLIQSYVIKLSAGVHITVGLDIPSTKAYLDIFGVQTGALLNFTAHANSWSGNVPSTQEYVIEVIPTGGYLTSYGLTVSIP